MYFLKFKKKLNFATLLADTGFLWESMQIEIIIWNELTLFKKKATEGKKVRHLYGTKFLKGRDKYSILKFEYFYWHSLCRVRTLIWFVIILLYSNLFITKLAFLCQCTEPKLSIIAFWHKSLCPYMLSKHEQWKGKHWRLGETCYRCRSFIFLKFEERPLVVSSMEKKLWIKQWLSYVQYLFVKMGLG